MDETQLILLARSIKLESSKEELLLDFRLNLKDKYDHSPKGNVAKLNLLLGMGLDTDPSWWLIHFQESCLPVKKSRVCLQAYNDGPGRGPQHRN